jgi:hypothetical protein
MNCSICGKEIKTSYGPKMNEQMLSRKMCFHCNYWQDRVERIGSPTQIIIDGYIYQNAGDKPGAIEGRDVAFMGHGGHRFTWRMLETGEIQTSNDMWFNGKPYHPHFQELLPDNAEWVK